MSKVDWITWKTDVSEIINPNDISESITDSYIDYNSYMNPVIYENIKYEVLNGGLDRSSLNIMGQSPANELAINILNKIDEIKSIVENLQLQINNATDEQKSIEKEQLISAIEEKIEEEKANTNDTSNEIINSLQDRLEIAKSL